MGSEMCIRDSGNIVRRRWLWGGDLHAFTHEFAGGKVHLSAFNAGAADIDAEGMARKSSHAR